MSESEQPESPPVNKVAVAVKHPGVFMQTSELESETGRLPEGKSELIDNMSPEGDNEAEVADSVVDEGVKSSPPPSPKPEAKVVVAKKTPKRGGKRARKRKSSAKLPIEPLEDADAEENEKAAPEVKKEEGEKTIKDEEKATEVDPDDKAEVEMTRDKVEVKTEDEEASGEEEEDAEPPPEERDPPSPVVTRRSNRKLQQQLKAEQQQVKEVEDNPTTDGENAADRFEIESVNSEIDSASVASGSTLTTRSSRRSKLDNSSTSKTSSTKAGSRAQKGSSTKIEPKSATANTKGKSRRIIFKKSATKAPSGVARAVTSDRVYYKGQYYTRGDIVSVVDVDGGVFYAQLRGFLTDQYCEKSGVVTWLLPTAGSPEPERAFDPSTYVVGPEEELPRKLDYFTFVMHAPDDYFYYRKAPYPTRAIETDQEYVVTKSGPKIRLVKAGKAVFREA